MDPTRLLFRSFFQLLDLVTKPVKAVILLFPIRGKLEELRQQEEAKLKEEGEGRVPVDPTVFWIKQTVRFRWRCSTNE
jgi:ubiquitin carboxyl-terminal hydrolase L3